MALFDRFRRNRQQSVLPDEVKQYYQTEKRQRRGMAVLLAIVALVATVAIAAGLFFAGRFIYNKVTDKDTKTAQPADAGDNKDKKDEAGFGDQDTDSSNDNPGSTPGEQPATPPSSTPGSPEATPTPAAPAPAPTPPATTPALGDNDALPHTGDEGM